MQGRYSKENYLLEGQKLEVVKQAQFVWGCWRIV